MSQLLHFPPRWLLGKVWRDSSRTLTFLVWEFPNHPYSEDTLGSCDVFHITRILTSRNQIGVANLTATCDMDLDLSFQSYLPKANESSDWRTPLRPNPSANSSIPLTESLHAKA